MTPSTDPRPAEEIRFLRASVAHQCNLSCVYCPKSSGMENHTPARLREPGHRLTTAQYCRNLDHIADSGVLRGISFTGGEPTLNPDLPVLVAHARSRFDRVELTTNGKHLAGQIDRLAPHLDVIKVSLDAVDPTLSHQIMRGRPADHDVAVAAIRMSLAAGLAVGINIVAMRRNLNQIPRIVRLARTLRRQAGAGTLYVSVLDLYYTDETRALWLDEFVPIDRIASQLRERLGGSESQDRGGCEINWWQDDGVQIRLKSSYESTYRAQRCTRCPVYCQEGFYGLKHSVEGWVTPCPSSAEDLGVHLPAGLAEHDAQARLRPLLQELTSTRRVENSFNEFLRRRGLADAHHRATIPMTPVTASERDHG
ncbi:radical SAM protein [Micromonospora aurantiaca (nom. illeg.)]|uniref:radical SAM protein n=1 Tax=Micromonospora aurantiaca (nom. illeg.) TaxID=47850 RepID=UPI0008287AC5|nr:radical SAM protein [Micromonospora aurantiaca]SCL36095.1 Molybdenum cofactor biosynthesis enzyme MoaA [Micromonospora aurantiaca]